MNALPSWRQRMTSTPTGPTPSRRRISAAWSPVWRSTPPSWTPTLKSTPGAGELLQILRDGGARTKAELAAYTGLARSTVAGRIDVLLAAGLASPAGEAASTGGRPPARVAFNPRAGIVLAIDLGATHATIAIVDLAHQILDSHATPLDIAAGPETVLNLVLAEGATLMARGKHDVSTLLGVGIGVPGPVEYSTGRPTNPPIMPGWDRFDVPGYVQRALPVPVFVDNDVNVLALGEHALSWPDVDDLIFVKVSTGIGAGIISGGALQRGAQGSAGDMGHVLPHLSLETGVSTDAPGEIVVTRNGSVFGYRPD